MIDLRKNAEYYRLASDLPKCGCDYSGSISRDLVSILGGSDEQEKLVAVTVHAREGTRPKLYLLECLFNDGQNPGCYSGGQAGSYEIPAGQACDKKKTARTLRKEIKEMVLRKELPESYLKAEIIWEEEPKKHE
jgi:hypothetical protein